MSSVDFDDLGIEDLRLPSVRSLQLHHQNVAPSANFMRSLDAHGLQLVSFGSGLMSVHDSGSILTRCPALQELLLGKHIYQMPEPTATYPSIVRLGVQVSMALRRDLSGEFKWGWFPNLRVVRVVDIQLDDLEKELRV